MAGLLLLLIVIAATAGFVVNRRAARRLRAQAGRLHSLEGFHGGWAAALIALPALAAMLAVVVLREPVIDELTLRAMPAEAVEGLDAGERALLLTELRSLADGRVFGQPSAEKLAAARRMAELRRGADLLMLVLAATAGALGFLAARRSLSPGFRARQAVERVLTGLMLGCAALAVLTTAGIFASLVVEAARFFARVPIHEFLFGLNWEPQIPLRADQVAAEGAFGWIPVLVGTLVITVIACAVAIPVGIFTAIYLHEFAAPRVRAVAKPALEILAGVPTVVYGFFAVLTVAPALRAAGAWAGLDVSPNTALAAGGVMGVMLIPFISSFADDALSAVPRSLRDGSLALGATQGETVMKVLFPAAIPGIVGGVLLAVSRAIGETMIVVMAAGLMAKLTINPLDSVTTVTVQIVTLLIGDTSFDNPKTLAAFALGLMLFLLTLGLNVIALRVVRKYREIYD
ncbi:phosphate ABC transporter permease subunit PstC [Oceanicella actignis]|uniref:Phosphate transport system permease protein n=1 Tax=Oceanicella actignis TaxID=1189325 RepID=A0A1M7SRU2_9RHOB|nr:phosphate ABC transporter permease subunit PstC [Oceanicella actignis]SES68060.1 phosphate ABC transporter membrane protein 1, PhoT family (TC 3.A.1.7.1) [Oceanicella actignis]SHN61141.1 phosphate transport system permease protein [Oceanicella actignis]